MVNDKRVNLVSFTGSSTVGQQVKANYNLIHFGPNYISFYRKYINAGWCGSTKAIWSCIIRIRR